MFPYPGFYMSPSVTPEQAERNARELIDQEEQDREKANKKRMKKKKQRERKRQQKLGESSKDMEDSAGDPDENRSEASYAESIDLESINGELSETDGEENLDLKSTFLQHVQKKVENKTPPETIERTNHNSHERRTTKPHDAVFVDEEVSFPETPSKETNGVCQDPIQKSLDLATNGNDLAEKEHFAEAIEHYTEAIKLNPAEFRFLGNRSYIFERYGKYAEALKDAEDALSLHPGFIKGHFRKGKALKGLQKYPEAIEAFLTIWESDACHMEAAAEVAQCKVKMQDLAGSRGVHSNPTVRPDHSPNGFMGGNGRELVTGHLSYSRACQNTPTPITNVPVATMSRVYPVWVGNVTNTITEEVLRSKFEPFGPIYSMRVLHARKCAFINFSEKQDAERAVRELQGSTVDGTTFLLQLKPDHPNLVIPVA